MKRLLLLATSLSLLATNAFAISRYDIRKMTCEEVQAVVRGEGAVILSYGSSSVLGLPIYDRYVNGQNYCASGEIVRTAGVPTLDQDYCPVKKCVASDIFVSD